MEVGAPEFLLHQPDVDHGLLIQVVERARDDRTWWTGSRLTLVPVVSLERYDIGGVKTGGDRPVRRRYFQQCRKIRNLSTYPRSGIVSSAEVKELIEEAERFGQMVRRWVGEKYPEYC